jgi:CRISPR system Cascade subunit CasE
MYLTRLSLDAQNPAARRDLASVYDMHRTLVRAFVEDETSQPSRFLWRLEVARGSWDKPIVLVQSAKPGRWSPIHRLSGYLRQDIETKQVALDRLVQPGRRYLFRLLANPTVCRQRKRYALMREEEQLAWINRQGQQHGFEVLSSVVTAKERCRDRKIVIDRVRFEGLLRAENPDCLRQALVAGIGPGKALGCGLLSIAPC